MAAVGEAKFKFECPGRGLSRVRWGSRAGRRALGALASAGPGAGEGGARHRCHARGAGPGAGVRARWTRAGQLLVNRTAYLFRLTWLHLEAKITPFRSLEDLGVTLNYFS